MQFLPQCSCLRVALFTQNKRKNLAVELLSRKLSNGREGWCPSKSCKGRFPHFWKSSKKIRGLKMISSLRSKRLSSVPWNGFLNNQKKSQSTILKNDLTSLQHMSKAQEMMQIHRGLRIMARRGDSSIALWEPRGTKKSKRLEFGRQKGGPDSQPYYPKTLRTFTRVTLRMHQWGKVTYHMYYLCKRSPHQSHRREVSR